MKRSQAGFGVIETLLVLIIVVVLGLIGWFLWENNKISHGDQKITVKEGKDITPNDDPLTLDPAKLPAGWKAEIKETQRALIKKAATGCYVDAIAALDDTATEAGATAYIKDERALTLSTLQSQGQDVQELSTASITLATKTGEQQFPGQELHITSPSSAAYQNYVYIIKDGLYIRFQLSCPKQADVMDARTAALAISVKP